MFLVIILTMGTKISTLVRQTIVDQPLFGTKILKGIILNEPFRVNFQLQIKIIS